MRMLASRGAGLVVVSYNYIYNVTLILRIQDVFQHDIPR